MQRESPHRRIEKPILLVAAGGASGLARFFRCLLLGGLFDGLLGNLLDGLLGGLLRDLLGGLLRGLLRYLFRHGTIS